jgi:hypothetical protein
VGRYRDGTIGQFTNIYALIRLVTAGRIHILPASPCASLDLVPIDHVIGGLTDIAERMATAAGHTYHLVSGAPVPVAELRTLALGYQQLHAPRFVPPESFERGRLSRAEQTLDRQVTSLYASYLQRDPCPGRKSAALLQLKTEPRQQKLVNAIVVIYVDVNGANRIPDSEAASLLERRGASRGNAAPWRR